MSGECSSLLFIYLPPTHPHSPSKRGRGVAQYKAVCSKLSPRLSGIPIANVQRIGQKSLHIKKNVVSCSEFELETTL